MHKEWATISTFRELEGDIAAFFLIVICCTSCHNDGTAGREDQNSSLKPDSSLLLETDYELNQAKALQLLPKKPAPGEASLRFEPGVTWKTLRGWDSNMETLYSAWIGALFNGCGEQSSWTALHVVTQDKDRNILFNYLSLGEDDPTGKNSVIMQPDCADNPFFLRAYFAWKLGLPFGYHLCDRGYIGRNPKTGQWITNESHNNKNQPVQAFNDFLRRMKDGIHSGTART